MPSGCADFRARLSDNPGDQTHPDRSRARSRRRAGYEAAKRACQRPAEGVRGQDVEPAAALPFQLLYALTLEAQKRVKASALSRRELIRRLGTSAAQFYRALDQTNYRKSIDQLLSLLQLLDCDVRLVVRPKSPSPLVYGHARVRPRGRARASVGVRTFPGNGHAGAGGSVHNQAH